MPQNNNRILIGALLLSVLTMSGLAFAASPNSAGQNVYNQGQNLTWWKAHAQARIELYNNNLNAAQQRATAFASNGVNISNIALLISNARAQIVDPLQNAVNTATSVSQIQQAMQEYCLYNGCGATANGTMQPQNYTDYHFAAYFQMYLLADRVEALQNTNINLSPVTAYLNNASSVLASVGTGRYQGTQSKQIWSSIRDARHALRQVLRYAGTMK